MEIQAVADKAKELHAAWSIVEQNRHSRDILKDARISLNKLKKCFAK